MRVFSLLLIGFVVAAAGCTKESNEGGPGVDTGISDAGKTVDDVDRPADTFTLSVPAGETNVTQGEQENVTVSVNRGSNFNQAVSLKFKTPAGVTVTPAETVIQSEHDKATVTLEAANTAVPGVASVEVVGVPQTGKSISVAMKVDVKQR